VQFVRRGRPRVVALGGGAFVPERNRGILATAGVSIWLECSPEVLWGRVSHEGHRPLARDQQAFQLLLSERQPTYSLADFRVAAETGTEETVSAILALGLL